MKLKGKERKEKRKGRKEGGRNTHTRLPAWRDYRTCLAICRPARNKHSTIAQKQQRVIEAARDSGNVSRTHVHRYVCPRGEALCFGTGTALAEAVEAGCKHALIAHDNLK